MTEENRNTQVAREVADRTPWLILFTILLLVGKVVGWWANMGWGWVFAPLWMPFAAVMSIMVIMLFVGLVALICVLIREWLGR